MKYKAQPSHSRVKLAIIPTTTRALFVLCSRRNVFISTMKTVKQQDSIQRPHGKLEYTTKFYILKLTVFIYYPQHFKLLASAIWTDCYDLSLMWSSSFRWQSTCQTADIWHPKWLPSAWSNGYGFRLENLEFVVWIHKLGQVIHKDHWRCLWIFLVWPWANQWISVRLTLPI